MKNSILILLVICGLISCRTDVVDSKATIEITIVDNTNKEVDNAQIEIYNS